MPTRSIEKMLARFVAVAAMGLALVVAGCGKQRPEAAPQAVRAGVAQLVRPDAPEHYSASFLPESQVDLTFKSSGLVESLLQVRGADGRMRDVEPGDKVTRGTALAVVRNLDYAQRLDQARQQLRQAEAQLAGAQAVFEDAELDFTRATNLYKTASLTKPDYDQAQARRDSTSQQVVAAKAQVESAKTSVAQAQLALSDATLRAPFTGWVVSRNVSVGTLATGAQAAFTMVDISSVKAMFAVPDTSLASVHSGERMAVNLDALDRPVEGVVTALSAVADPKSRVFTVEITVPNRKEEIRPGMIGAIALGGVPDAKPRLMIPLSAVVSSQSGSSAFAVFLVEDRQNAAYARLRPVTVGATFGNSIEVTAGLNAGDRVITLGGELVRDGQLVRVL